MFRKRVHKAKGKRVRRNGEGGWRRLQKGVNDTWQRLLEVPGVWLGLLLLLGIWVLLPRGIFFNPVVEPGSIAAQDFIAPNDLLLLDEETTRQRQEQAREEVPPLYDFDPSAETDQHLAELFARGRRLLAAGERAGGDDAAAASDLAGPLIAATPLKLTAEQVAVLAHQEFSPEIEDRMRGLAAQILRRGVVENKERLLENRLRGITLRHLGAGGREQHSFDLYDYLAYPDEVREMVVSEVRDWSGLTAAERRELSELLVANLPPNLYPNRSETLLRQEAVAEATPPSFNQIRQGQVIVRKGDEIDPAAAQVMTSYRRGSTPIRGKILPALGNLLLLGFVSLVVWLALHEERVADHSPRRLFGEALLLLTVSLLGAKLNFVMATALAAAFESAPLTTVRSYLYAVPFAAFALCIVLLLGRQAALVLSAIFSILVSRLAGAEAEGLWVLVYSFAGSLAAIYGIGRYQVKPRLVLTRVGLVVGVVNVMVLLMLRALGGGAEGTLVQLAFDLVCAFTGGLLVAAVASFAVPIFEAALGITTDIKLAELANTNLPLLRRLAFEAPGSFQHSLMVANLAKQACEAIGADGALAHTGGLYHDIGKVFRPDYFIENQRAGHNPHDRLQPTMSALILISHIKDGLELAHEHHLPRPILEAIEQHHGTRLIKFFYNRAVEQHGGEGAEVSEEKFRYPGPRPQNRVMGVLMLADGVEAASRTLVEPSPTKIRSLINQIIEDCLHDGQLDETDLTLSDIKSVAETFFRVLSNIFHQRVDYPGFDFNTGAGGEKEVRLSAVGGTRAS